MAWRNLGRNRRRNLATGAAIACGYAGLLLLGGYIVHTEHYLRVNSIYLNHAGHISIYRKGGLENYLTRPSRYNLSPSDQEKIIALTASDPELEFLGRYLKGAGLLGNGCKSYPFFGTGIDVEAEKRIRAHPEVLRWNPELARIQSGRGVWEQSPSTAVVSLTAGLVRMIGKPSVYDEIPGSAWSKAGLPDCASPSISREIASDSNVQLAGSDIHGGFSAVDAEIVSHYSSGIALSDESGLIAPLSLLQSLYNTSSVTYLALYLRPNASVHAYLNRLSDKFAKAGLELSLYPFDSEEVSLFYVGILNFLLTMAAFFAFLILGVVILSIVNAQTMSVIERTREIGTLRSIGFSREFVAGAMACETLLLSLVSLAIGLAATILLIAAINALNIRFYPPGIANSMQFMLNLNPELCALLALLILGVACETSRRTTLSRTKRRVYELMISPTG